MAFTIPDDSPIIAAGLSANVSWVDAHGHAAAVEGQTIWASSNETLATVAADPSDSTSALVQFVPGVIGAAQITASADADLGSGVQTIIAIGDLSVVPGQAVAGEIVFGAV